MAKDRYEIGSAPNEESCAQVGSVGYRERALRECKAYKAQLERAYPGMPEGMYLTVASHQHDFGTYYDVCVVYDDENEAHNDFIWSNLENGCDVWDDVARKELGLDGSFEEGQYVPPSALGEDVEELAFASVVPACCSSGCQVEPDGKCSHGHPSILVAMGLI